MKKLKPDRAAKPSIPAPKHIGLSVQEYIAVRVVTHEFRLVLHARRIPSTSIVQLLAPLYRARPFCARRATPLGSWQVQLSSRRRSLPCATYTVQTSLMPTPCRLLASVSRNACSSWRSVSKRLGHGTGCQSTAALLSVESAGANTCNRSRSRGA